MKAAAPRNVSEFLISSHLVEGSMTPGDEIALQIDQTLTQDATGTLVMLELEAMQLDRVKTACSVQYTDHNLVQVDHRNPDDHAFLYSACRRFGLYFSPPGNGVSHPVHQESFGKPGTTLVGSDSHTPAAGALGMLAFGAGGIEVAMAMIGEPLRLQMPEIWGIRLEGRLPDWVSAKDVILELLRRHDVDGGVGRILEYHGPGLDTLSTMDRHVIANMGTELGATTTVFPSDATTREFLRRQQREGDWQEIVVVDPEYDHLETIDLSQLEPLIAMPSSPGNVQRVADVAGEPIYQAYIGSSANPGYRDFAVAARIVAGQRIEPRVSFDINPSSRQVLANLTRDGHLASLIAAGARIHQAGCNGCIGMGQAPATDQISLRTVPRNFPGRSGTKEDKVCLVSPETAAASALRGVITDPRTLDQPYPRVEEPNDPILLRENLIEPIPAGEALEVDLVKGPNIKSLPALEPIPDSLKLVIALKVGDDISTDEILPAGTRVLPYRSNIPEIANFAFEPVDPGYVQRTKDIGVGNGHAIVGGENYGQGSSREHAALAPRYLGLRVVIAKSFARIHWQNLVNFGVIPLTFADVGDFEQLDQGDTIQLGGLHQALAAHSELDCSVAGRKVRVRHSLSARQVEVLLAGGLINLKKQQLETS